MHPLPLVISVLPGTSLAMRPRDRDVERNAVAAQGQVLATFPRGAGAAPWVIDAGRQQPARVATMLLMVVATGMLGGRLAQ